MSVLTNWKTSLGGAILIVITVLHQFLGISVPGFSMDIGAAFATGLGLIFANDAGKPQS